MSKKYVGFRAVVALVAIYHILLGITLNAPAGCIEAVAKGVLGATTMPAASALFLARMSGTYLIVFGIGIGLAAYDPIKNRALLSLAAIVVVLRASQRVVQAGDLETALGITARANWSTITIMLLLAAILLVFRLIILRDMKAASDS